MEKDLAPPSTPLVETPVWIRTPQAVLLTGLSRSTIYALISEGRIRTASLRDPGERHGARLIDRADLLRYLDSLATGGKA